LLAGLEIADRLLPHPVDADHVRCELTVRDRQRFLDLVTVDRATVSGNGNGRSCGELSAHSCPTSNATGCCAENRAQRENHTIRGLEPEWNRSDPLASLLVGEPRRPAVHPPACQRQRLHGLATLGKRGPGGRVRIIKTGQRWGAVAAGN
jgi:hypothetical protein